MGHLSAAAVFDVSAAMPNDVGTTSVDYRRETIDSHRSSSVDGAKVDCAVGVIEFAGCKTGVAVAAMGDVGDAASVVRK